MSRNLGRTDCPVCHRSFTPTTCETTTSDVLLMTEDEYLKAIDWKDCPYKGNLGYGWAGTYGSRVEVRFAKLKCQDCGRRFAGWYRQQYPRGWLLFDSSYYFAFNDEPSEKDEADAREVAAEQKQPAHALNLPWHLRECGGSYECMIIDCIGRVTAKVVNKEDAEAVVEAMNRSVE